MPSFFDLGDSHRAKRIGMLAVALVIVAVVMLILFGDRPVSWIGAFPFEVTLVVRNDKQVARVLRQVVRWKEEAEALRAEPRAFEKHPVGFELNLTPVTWQPGETFEIDVPNSGTDWGFGRGCSYSQFEVLVVVVEFADGSKEYAAVDIPDGRKQRKLLVEVP